MSHDNNEEFQSEFRIGLGRLEDELVGVLRQLIRSEYPAAVVAIDFEIFPNGWSADVPVRAFFMDSANCEHFIYVDGKADYPSPVDPALLAGNEILTSEFEEILLERFPDLDTFALGVQQFVPWFSDCWQRAGGRDFRRNATVAAHDDDREFNLITQKWQGRYAGFGDVHGHIV
jgi:hypothetical protein